MSKTLKIKLVISGKYERRIEKSNRCKLLIRITILRTPVLKIFIKYDYLLKIDCEYVFDQTMNLNEQYTRLKNNHCT